MSEQSCGECRHYRAHTTTRGDCAAPLPPMPTFPLAVSVRLNVKWNRMMKSFGSQCQTFERKEGGDGKA